MNHLNIFWVLTYVSLVICIIGMGRKNYQLIKAHRHSKDALKACELIVDVKHCMMFTQVHADWMVKEILDKHGASSIQLLAKKAQDAAERALSE